MADCQNKMIMLSREPGLKEEERECFVLCVFSLFLFKHQSLNLRADPTAEVMLWSQNI